MIKSVKNDLVQEHAQNYKKSQLHISIEHKIIENKAIPNKAIPKSAIQNKAIQNRILYGKIIPLMIVCILFMTLFTTQGFAQVQPPATMRVGIHFGTTTMSSYTIKADKGIEIGSHKDGKTTVLITHNAFTNITVRKDAYFVKDASNRYIEYFPTEGIPSVGEIYGPYHIKVAAAYNSFNDAKTAASGYIAKGVLAYPVYTGNWEVWAGFYDTPDAQQAGLNTVKQKLGALEYTLIQPNMSRTWVENPDGTILFMFARDNEFLRIKPKAENSPYAVYVNDKKFRGEIETRRFSDSDMTVINVVDFEEYLYGVVPYEMPSSFPIEALKAQAVAARTYSMGNLGKFSKWSFDVTNTQSSQVYNGISGERETTNRAVNETKGKKLTYGGKLSGAYYSSSSGGRTADVKEVWGSSVPYLLSVEDKYEAANNYQNWTVTLTKDEIKLKLFVKNIEIGDIVSVIAEEYGESGRVIQMRIVGTESSVTFHRDNCRNILGLYSQMFTINAGDQSNAPVHVISGNKSVANIDLAGKKVVSSGGEKVLSGQSMFILGSGNKKVSSSGATNTNTNTNANTITFTGSGYGHGVGMSQYGAKGMAEAGFSYEQILKHYYSGITIE